MGESARKSFYVELQERHDRRASVSIIDLPKADGRFALERDSVLFGTVIIEGTPAIISYIPQSECISVPFLQRNNKETAVRADAIVKVSDGTSEWRSFSREPLPGRVAQALSTAASERGASYKNYTSKDFIGWDLFVDNWLLLNAARVRGRGYGKVAEFDHIKKCLNFGPTTVGELFAEEAGDQGILLAALGELLAKGHVICELKTRLLTNSSMLQWNADPIHLNLDAFREEASTRMFYGDKIENSNSDDDNPQTRSRGRPRSLLPKGYGNPEAWRRPDVDRMEPADKLYFERVLDALTRYARGESFQEIEEHTDFKEGGARYLLKRFGMRAKDGTPLGLFAFVKKGAHAKPYDRKAPVRHVSDQQMGGAAGAFHQMLKENEDIQDYIDGELANQTRPGRPTELKVPYKAIHEGMLALLRTKGYEEEGKYPFGWGKLGYDALLAYCDVREATLMGEQASYRHGKEAARRGNMRLDVPRLLEAKRCLTFMQLDFHKVDADSVIVFKNAYGKDFRLRVQRWHFGLMVDELGGINGVAVVLKPSPDTNDVLEVMDSSIRDWSVTEGDIRYTLAPTGDIVIQAFLPGVPPLGFSVLRMDNAMYNQAIDAIHNIIDVFGCAIHFGPPRAWYVRACIERIFGTLTRRGLQRMASSLGANPTDVRRDDSAEKAAAFEIKVSDLIGIIFAEIRHFNITPSKRLQGSSPLEVVTAALDKRLANNAPWQVLPQYEGRDWRLFAHVEVIPARGNRAKNKKPEVEKWGIIYTNDKLERRFDLIGEPLEIVIDRRDKSRAEATVLKGREPLGALRVTGPARHIQSSPEYYRLLERMGVKGRFNAPVENAVNQFKDSRQKPKRKRATTKPGAPASTPTAAEALNIAQRNLGGCADPWHSRPAGHGSKVGPNLGSTADAIDNSSTQLPPEKFDPHRSNTAADKSDGVEGNSDQPTFAAAPVDTCTPAPEPPKKKGKNRLGLDRPINLRAAR